MPYAPLENDTEGMAPRWAATMLFDVDDGPMLQKRQIVMNVCMAQVVMSFVLVTNYRRSPVLLILQPFFIGAAVLGYLGARDCKALFVAAHILGSAGLALVFFFFIIAETLLKHSQGQNEAGADLFFIVVNGPMDLFVMGTSVASIVLFLSLRQLRQQLRQRREEVREHFVRIDRDGGDERAGVPVDGSREGSRERDQRGAAAEQRRTLSALKQDLRCPITLEVMRDPVIAGDGHSYEREAIERWLSSHRTSPLTGSVIAHTTLIPNHRLRTLIQGLDEQVRRPGAMPMHSPTSLGPVGQRARPMTLQLSGANEGHCPWYRVQ